MWNPLAVSILFLLLFVALAFIFVAAVVPIEVVLSAQYRNSAVRQVDECSQEHSI
jgi:hypothetical protein